MRSNGTRRGTRQVFKQEFRKHGVARVSKYLTVFEIGDWVDIKVNPAHHKGMPHKFYHGKTGQVFAIRPRSLGIFFYKRVCGRFVQKFLNVRPEHVRKSKCRDSVVQREKEWEARIEKAKGTGIKPEYPRAVMPGARQEFVLSLENNEPVELKYKPFIPIY